MNVVRAVDLWRVRTIDQWCLRLSEEFQIQDIIGIGDIAKSQRLVVVNVFLRTRRIAAPPRMQHIKFKIA